MTQPSAIDTSKGTDELVLALRRFAGLVQRRWRTFVAIFVVSVPAVLLVTFLWPGTFAAHAAVLLQKTRSSSAVDYDPKQPTTVVTGAVSEQEVNSEIAVLTSRTVLQATVDAAGLAHLPEPWYIRIALAPLRAYEHAYDWYHDVAYPSDEERAVNGLSAALSVERLKDSNVLVVNYRSGSPAMAEAVLNELLKQYLDLDVKVHNRGNAQQFFDAQTERLSGELDKLHAELQQAKQAVGVVDFDEARRVALQQQATLQAEESTLVRREAELDGKLTSYRQTVASEQKVMHTSTTTKTNSQALDTMRAQLMQLQVNEIQLETRYVETARPVVENRRKIEAARQAIEAAEHSVPEDSTQTLNPTVVAIQQEMAQATADVAGVRERLAAVRSQLKALDSHLVELDRRAMASARLELQLTSARDRYAMYLDRAERARVDAALDQTGVTNASIVQSAAASTKPVRPRRLISLIIALLGGLIAAALVCAWQELMEMGLAEGLEHAAPRGESPQLVS